MTLLELLIALALTGGVAVTGYGVLTTTIDAGQTTRAQMQPVSEAAEARALLSTWIGSAHTSGEEDGVEFVGVDATGKGVVDVLTFTTSNARPLTNGPALMRVSIDNDSLTRERGLIADAWYGSSKHRRLAVLPEATLLNIEYFGEIEGIVQWWPSWRSAVRLPTAVRLSISTTDSIRTVSQIPLIILLAPTQ